MRTKNRDYRVALSNGKTLRIVAPSPQRALNRANKWCGELDGSVKVVDINEVV